MRDVRIGDAEREHAMSELGRHYADGRLEHSEYDERLDAVGTARTAADLAMLFEDLPAPVNPRLRPEGRRSPVPTRRHQRPPLGVILTMIAVIVLFILL